MSNPNYIFLISLCIIILGFTVKKLGLLSRKSGNIIAKLILNVTLPALILNTFSNIDVHPQLIVLPFLCLGYSILISLFSHFIFRNQDIKIRGQLRMSTISFNIGLFAYPLIEGIWGIEGMKYIIMFDIGNSFVIFFIAYSIGFLNSPKNQGKKEEGEKKIDYKKILKKIFSSIPFLSLLIALGLNIANLQIPVFLLDIFDVLSMANMPLTLLVLGVFLSFDFDKSYWSQILKVLVIRYGFGLMAGILICFLLPFEKVYNAVILTALILPVGMTNIAFTAEFEYDEKLASLIVNLTNLISFVLMWLIVIVIGV
jgi:predicted permease